MEETGKVGTETTETEPIKYNKPSYGRPEGGNFTEMCKIYRDKPIKVNPRYESPEINVAPFNNNKKKPQTFRCCMCGHEYTAQIRNFPTGGRSILWKGNNGYLPFCKHCCEILINTLISFYSGNEEHALRHMCCIFGWFYDPSISGMTYNSIKPNTNRFTFYPSRMNMRMALEKGQSFLDTIREEVTESGVISDTANLPTDENVQDEEDFIVTKEIVHRWGAGYTAEQYEYLEIEYGDWIAKNPCNTKAQEELYKNIALAQLNVRLTRETGGKVTEAMEALQKLMNSANILPKQNVDNVVADTQTFGTLIKRYEETRPIPEPSKNLKDVDSLHKYINAWFKGGLAKALKIKNTYSDEYDEYAKQEYEKYTVRPPEATGADAINDSSIFDAESAEPQENSKPVDKGGGGSE